MLLRILFTLVIFGLAFVGMITAFHLLNLPSTPSVFAGIGLLLLVAAAALLALRLLWKKAL